MSGTRKAFFLGAAICATGLLAVRAQENRAEKHDIKGGIEGKIVKVDVESKTLTIMTDQGRERAFTITDETIMLGPRGGKVRRHLKDPRFREGFPVTIVADRNTAHEVHLGFARDASGEHGADAKTAKYGSKTTDKTQEPAPSRIIRGRTPPGADTETPAKSVAKGKTATKPEEEDDENEIPGTVKSFDPARRILVIALLNGKEKSFILAKDVPVHVRGTVSRQGLRDSALKEGAHIEVVTDEGGRKVKELKILAARLRRAG
jgi:hypothetical protein